MKAGTCACHGKGKGQAEKQLGEEHFSVLRLGQLWHACSCAVRCYVDTRQLQVLEEEVRGQGPGTSEGPRATPAQQIIRGMAMILDVLDITCRQAMDRMPDHCQLLKKCHAGVQVRYVIDLLREDPGTEDKDVIGSAICESAKELQAGNTKGASQARARVYKIIISSIAGRWLALLACMAAG
jgi:hypothetical protein